MVRARVSGSPRSLTGASIRVKSRLQPREASRINGYHIKAARRRLAQAHQVMTRRKHDAALLDTAHAGRRTAVRSARALAYLDKHQRARRVAHDQVDFPASATRRPIIALQQAQSRGLQMLKRPLFRGVAGLLGRGWLAGIAHLCVLFEEFH